jgi:hypothetical protein
MSSAEQRGHKGQRAMTETTQAIRNQAFRPMTADIPEGLTLRQYRSARSRPQQRRGWRGRARLRLTLR